MSRDLREDEEENSEKSNLSIALVNFLKCLSGCL